jgi:hypothetical protein
MRIHRVAAPLTILCGSLAAGAAALVGLGGPVQAMLGVLMIVLIPGASAIALLGVRLAPADALLAAGACSIAIAILAGIVLGATGAGFDSATTTVAIAGISVVLSGAALARRATGRAIAADGPVRSAPRLPAGGASLALYAGAAAVVVLAVAVAHRSAADHARSDGIAELWMSPAGGGSRDGARVGVSAPHERAGGYRLELAPQGRASRDIALAPGPRGGLAAEARMPAAGRATLRGGSPLAPIRLEVGSLAHRRSSAHRRRAGRLAAAGRGRSSR